DFYILLDPRVKHGDDNVSIFKTSSLKQSF
ncbi:unnamed protein product, partial [marine sediment metagenome]